MSTITKPRMVPIKMLADLAQLALDTVAAQDQHFRSKLLVDRFTLGELQRRLGQAASDALTLNRTTPAMFADETPPAAEPIVTVWQVMSWLEGYAAAMKAEDLHDRDEADREMEVRLIHHVIDIIDPDPGENLIYEETAG